MKVNNLYIVNTRLITKVVNYNNFSRDIKSIDNGYKIVEKKRVEVGYKKRLATLYFLPGTKTNLVTYDSVRNEGEIFRTKPILSLNKFCDKEELSLVEIKQLEKEFNEEGLVKKKKR